MATLIDTLTHAEFRPLPLGDGARKAGIEIEFGGLEEEKAAALIAETVGGRVVKKGDHEFRIENTDIGMVKVVLDTAFRARHPSPMKAALLDLSRVVVPVEIVTEPLDLGRLPIVDRLRATLRAAGATGSRSGLFLGFGVHLNIDVPGEDADDIIPTVTAFAFAEDWLRRETPIDTTRRFLPFVDPYPRRFVDRLAQEGPGWSTADLTRVYLEETPSRNRGLDLLPLLRHIDEPTVVEALGDMASPVHARPAWHYRVPDSRIDETAWSLAYEWNRWRVVECIAANRPLLERLRADWMMHRDSPTSTTGDWRRHLEDVLTTTPDIFEAA